MCCKTHHFLTFCQSCFCLCLCIHISIITHLFFCAELFETRLQILGYFSMLKHSFPKNKDIFLYNHRAMITFRKFPNYTFLSPNKTNFFSCPSSVLFHNIFSSRCRIHLFHSVCWTQISDGMDFLFFGRSVRL